MPPRQDPEFVNLPHDDSGFVELDVEEPELQLIEEEEIQEQINEQNDFEEVELADAVQEDRIDIWHPVDPVQPTYDAGK